MDNQNQNTNLDEKLNINKHQPISMDGFDLSLDDELALNNRNLLMNVQRWLDDKYADIYKWFINHPLLTYSIKRIIYGLITLLIAIILIFVIVRSVTDNNQYLPQGIGNLNLTPEQIQQLLENRMKAFGVWGSLGFQLGNYLKDLVPFIPKDIVINQTWHLDASHNVIIENITKRVWLYLGVVTSPAIATPGTDVLGLFDKAIPYSFVFGLIAVVISYLVGIPLGIQAAKHKGKMADNSINSLAILLTAVPAVVIVIGIYLLATSGIGTSGLFSSGSFWSKFWPEITLILLILPPNVIMIRRYVIDEMTSEYVNFALSQGLSETWIYYVHIFRNAGVKVLRYFPLDLAAALFSSTILVEQQWSIPGMGRYIISAIGGQKDSFVIMGFVSFAAFIQIFSSLFSDLITVWLDPRVSLNQRK